MKNKKNTLYLMKINWIIFSLGILSIVLGYVFLAKESLTLSPILLVLGYAVLIPISLGFKGFRGKESKNEVK